MEENPMREIRIEKVTLNVGCGADAAKLERAKKLLEYLTGRKPFVTKSKRRSTFGVAKGKPIGAKVTLRKQAAIEFFKKILSSLDNKLKSSQFDKDGNLNVGVKEYIDLGYKYSHEIGMLGLDVAVTFARAGYRIAKRKIQRRKIPRKHRIKREEVMSWLKEKFGVTIE